MMAHFGSSFSSVVTLPVTLGIVVPKSTTLDDLERP